MFSKTQLTKFGEALGKKRISQETFNEAVRENIDEFEMEENEAIKSAIEEFKTQGVDLSGIYTGTMLQEHPVYKASREMQEYIKRADTSSLDSPLSVLEEQLEIHMQEYDSESRQQLIAVILASQTIALFEPGINALDGEPATLCRFLKVYSTILALSVDIKENFISEGRNWELIPFDHDDREVKFAALSVASSLAVKHEAGKGVIMGMKPENSILKVLDISKEESHTETGVQAASSLIVALSSADDLSQPSSSAFSNARKLAQSGITSSLLALLSLLWTDNDCSSSGRIKVTCNICTGLRLLAANDDICKELVEMNALKTLMVVLKSSLSDLAGGITDLTSSAMSLMRQMMASDHVKHSLDRDQFIEICCSILELFLEDTFDDTKVIEVTLGSISAYCLRNPEGSEAIVDSGCAQQIIASMQNIMDRNEFRPNLVSNIGKPLRQGCMALRNIASRSPEVRETLKSYSAIQVLENAKAMCRNSCEDVGDAAIRDITA